MNKLQEQNLLNLLSKFVEWKDDNIVSVVFDIDGVLGDCFIYNSKHNYETDFLKDSSKIIAKSYEELAKFWLENIYK